MKGLASRKRALRMEVLEDRTLLAADNDWLQYAIEADAPFDFEFNANFGDNNKITLDGFGYGHITIDVDQLPDTVARLDISDFSSVDLVGDAHAIDALVASDIGTLTVGSPVRQNFVAADVASISLENAPYSILLDGGHTTLGFDAFGPLGYTMIRSEADLLDLSVADPYGDILLMGKPGADNLVRTTLSAGEIIPSGFDAEDITYDVTDFSIPEPEPEPEPGDNDDGGQDNPGTEPGGSSGDGDGDDNPVVVDPADPVDNGDNDDGDTGGQDNPGDDGSDDDSDTDTGNPVVDPVDNGQIPGDDDDTDSGAEDPLTPGDDGQGTTDPVGGSDSDSDSDSDDGPDTGSGDDGDLDDATDDLDDIIGNTDIPEEILLQNLNDLIALLNDLRGSLDAETFASFAELVSDETLIQLGALAAALDTAPRQDNTTGQAQSAEAPAAILDDHAAPAARQSDANSATDADAATGQVIFLDDTAALGSRFLLDDSEQLLSYSEVRDTGRPSAHIAEHNNFFSSLVIVPDDESRQETNARATDEANGLQHITQWLIGSNQAVQTLKSYIADRIENEIAGERPALIVPTRSGKEAPGTQHLA